MLCFSISYSGLSGADTAAHIHGPGLPGVSAGIIFTLPGTASPRNGCVGPLDGTQKGELFHKELYVNVHTALNPGDEIRGQILRIK